MSPKHLAPSYPITGIPQVTSFQNGTLKILSVKSPSFVILHKICIHTIELRNSDSVKLLKKNENDIYTDIYNNYINDFSV